MSWTSFGFSAICHHTHTEHIIGTQPGWDCRTQVLPGFCMGGTLVVLTVGDEWKPRAAPHGTAAAFKI